MSCLDWSTPFSGKVIRMVLAEGRAEYGAESSDVGS